MCEAKVERSFARITFISGVTIRARCGAVAASMGDTHVSIADDAGQQYRSMINREISTASRPMPVAHVLIPTK